MSSRIHTKGFASKGTFFDNDFCVIFSRNQYFILVNIVRQLFRLGYCKFYLKKLINIYYKKT